MPKLLFVSVPTDEVLNKEGKVRFPGTDAAVEKLDKQLHKLKTKLQAKYHGKGHGAGKVGAGSAGDGANAAGQAPEDTDADTETDTARLVKTKRFPLKPMTIDEAILQMDLLGHQFYFFHNADSGERAVLYRRDDGDLGLIEAER